MDGEVVRKKSRLRSYVPVLMKSVSTLLRFDAQIKRRMGRPLCLANHAARMFPKLPVGTATSIASPALMRPAFSSSQ